MAGLTARNTKIAPSKLGCRLPFESADVGDGYAGASPCLVRKMTPEETSRYGPAVVPKDRDLTRGEVSFTVKNATSLEHAAKMARVSVARIKREMARHCIAVPEGWKEDETVNDTQENLDDSRENMDTIVQADTESQENQASRVDEKQGGSDKVVQDPPEFYEASHGRRFTAERIAKAEKSLSREEYIRLKGEGISDFKIIKTHKGFSSDLMIALKNKWGINIVLPGGPPKPQAKPEPPAVTALPGQPEEPREEPATQAAAAGLTIAQAVQLREELAEDVVSLSRILDMPAREAVLTDRIVRMVEAQRDIHQAALGRLNEAFERTVLPL